MGKPIIRKKRGVFIGYKNTPTVITSGNDNPSVETGKRFNIMDLVKNPFPGGSDMMNPIIEKSKVYLGGDDFDQRMRVISTGNNVSESTQRQGNYDNTSPLSPVPTNVDRSGLFRNFNYKDPQISQGEKLDSGKRFKNVLESFRSDVSKNPVSATVDAIGGTMDAGATYLKENLPKSLQPKLLKDYDNPLDFFVADAIKETENKRPEDSYLDVIANNFTQGRFLDIFKALGIDKSKGEQYRDELRYEKLSPEKKLVGEAANLIGSLGKFGTISKYVSEPLTKKIINSDFFKTQLKGFANKYGYEKAANMVPVVQKVIRENITFASPSVFEGLTDVSNGKMDFEQYTKNVLTSMGLATAFSLNKYDYQTENFFNNLDRILKVDAGAYNKAVNTYKDEYFRRFAKGTLYDAVVPGATKQAMNVAFGDEPSVEEFGKDALLFTLFRALKYKNPKLVNPEDLGIKPGDPINPNGNPPKPKPNQPDKPSPTDAKYQDIPNPSTPEKTVKGKKAVSDIYTDYVQNGVNDFSEVVDRMEKVDDGNLTDAIKTYRDEVGNDKLKAEKNFSDAISGYLSKSDDKPRTKPISADPSAVVELKREEKRLSDEWNAKFGKEPIDEITNPILVNTLSPSVKTRVDYLNSAIRDHNSQFNNDPVDEKPKPKSDIRISQLEDINSQINSLEKEKGNPKRIAKLKEQRDLLEKSITENPIEIAEKIPDAETRQDEPTTYVTKEEQDNIIKKHTHKGGGINTIFADWFLGESPDSKSAISHEIANNPALQNAMKSKLYDLWKKQNKSDISYNDFLNSEIDLFRGGKDKNRNERDVDGFNSWELTEEGATKFAKGEDVVKVRKKVKDLYGALDIVGGEIEILEPTRYSEKYAKKILDQQEMIDKMYNNLTRDEQKRISKLMVDGEYNNALETANKLLNKKESVKPTKTEEAVPEPKDKSAVVQGKKQSFKELYDKVSEDENGSQQDIIEETRAFVEDNPGDHPVLEQIIEEFDIAWDEHVNNGYRMGDGIDEAVDAIEKYANSLSSEKGKPKQKKPEKNYDNEDFSKLTYDEIVNKIVGVTDNNLLKALDKEVKKRVKAGVIFTFNKETSKWEESLPETKQVEKPSAEDVKFTAKGGNKVVDEMGEPIEVFHGTTRGGFSEFNPEGEVKSGNRAGIFFTDNRKISQAYEGTGKDIKKQGEYFDKEAELEKLNAQYGKNIEYKGEDPSTGLNSSYYSYRDKRRSEFEKRFFYDSLKKLTGSKKLADEYISKRDELSKKENNTTSGIYSANIHISNPLVVDFKGKNWDNGVFEGKRVTTNELTIIAMKRRHDGVIIKNVIDVGVKGKVKFENKKEKVSNVYVVFDKNNIKPKIEKPSAEEKSDKVVVKNEDNFDSLVNKFDYDADFYNMSDRQLHRKYIDARNKWEKDKSQDSKDIRDFYSDMITRRRGLKSSIDKPLTESYDEIKNHFGWMLEVVGERLSKNKPIPNEAKDELLIYAERILNSDGDTKNLALDIQKEYAKYGNDKETIINIAKGVEYVQKEMGNRLSKPESESQDAENKIKELHEMTWDKFDKLYDSLPTQSIPVKAFDGFETFDKHIIKVENGGRTVYTYPKDYPHLKNNLTTDKDVSVSIDSIDRFLKTHREDTSSYDYKYKMKKRITKQALSEGKTVPEDVMKDYPDLKKKKVVKKPESKNKYEAEREKGERVIGGVTYTRQPEQNFIEGKKTEIHFSKKDQEKGVYALVPVSKVQPSHKADGGINPYHFITEGQPRNRGQNKALRIEPDKKAKDLDPGKLGVNNIAFYGASVINQRGEVVQGSGRDQALIRYFQLYDNDPKGYQDYLKSISDQTGISESDIDKAFAEEPHLLQRVVNVSDNRAIELGNYVSSDMEDITGKLKSIDKSSVSRVTSQQMNDVANMITSRNNEDSTLNSIIRDLGKKIVEKLQEIGVIREDELELYINDHNQITADGIKNIESYFKESLFANGDVSLSEAFEKLPDISRKGIEKSIPNIISVEQEKSLITEIQNAIMGLYEFNGSDQKVLGDWLSSYDMFTGETISKRYTDPELELMKIFNSAKTQSVVVGLFSRYKELVSDIPEDLFNPEVIPGKSKPESLNIIFDGKEQKTIDKGKKEKPSGTDKKEIVSDRSTKDNADKKGDEENIVRESQAEYIVRDKSGQQVIAKVQKQLEKINKQLEIWESKDNQDEISTHKTSQGEEIRFVSANAGDNNNAFSEPGKIPYRQLTEGEQTSVERTFQKNNHFNFFSRTTKIESPEDVAYLFRQLESASVEHSFAFHESRDGRQYVQHLSTGTFNETSVDTRVIYLAAKAWDSVKITLVHNHPSGEVYASDADMRVVKRMKAAFDGDKDVEIGDGVILNLLDGKYGMFNESTDTGKGNARGENKYAVDTYSFDKLEFVNDVNIYDKAIVQPEDIATFLSKSKFGIGSKFQVIILNNANFVTARLNMTEPAKIELPKTKEMGSNQRNIVQNPKFIDEVIHSIAKFGGVQAIIVTNEQVITNRVMFNEIKRRANLIGFNLLDVVSVDPSDVAKNNYKNLMSYVNAGFLEKSAEYKKNSGDLDIKLKNLEQRRTWLEKRIDELDADPDKLFSSENKAGVQTQENKQTVDKYLKELYAVDGEIENTKNEINNLKSYQPMKDDRQISVFNEAVGAYEKKEIIDHPKYKKLVEDGYVTKDFDIGSIAGKQVIIVHADNMAVGTLIRSDLKGKENLMSLGGGVHYPANTNHIWSSTDTAMTKLQNAIATARQIDIDNGGDGTVYLAISKGTDSKALSNQEGSKHAMTVLEDLVELGLITAKDFHDAFHKTGNLIEKNKKSPNYGKSKYGLDFKDKKTKESIKEDNYDTKYIKDEVKKLFSSVDDATFVMRGSFVKDLIQQLSKTKSPHKNIEGIRKVLNTQSINRNISFSMEGVAEAIGKLFGDKMTHDVPQTHTYAMIEINLPTRKVKSNHPSYPVGIAQFDSSGKMVKAKLHFLKYTANNNDLFNDYDGTEYSRRDNAALGNNQTGTKRAVVKPKNQLPVAGRDLVVTSEGWVYGFEKHGDIILKEDGGTPKTELQKVGHIFINWAGKMKPDLLRTGLGLVKGSEYAKSVRIDKFYIERAGMLLNDERGAYFLREALVNAIGTNGSKFGSKAQREAFRQWTDSLWKAIARGYGVKGMSPETLRNMSIEDFTKKVKENIFRSKDSGYEEARRIINDFFSKDSGMSFMGLSKLGDLADPKVLKAIYDLGGYHIKNGSKRFFEWAKKMIQDAGQWIKKHLKDLWEKLTRNRTKIEDVVTQGFGKSGKKPETNPKDITEDLIRDLGMKLSRQVKTQKDNIITRLAGSRTLGIYFPGSGIIRIKNTNDIRTFAHELGHKLDLENFFFSDTFAFDKHDKAEKLVTLANGRKEPMRTKVLNGYKKLYGTTEVEWLIKKAEIRKELRKFAISSKFYNPNKLKETVANYIDNYITNRDEAMTQNPIFTQVFESMLNQDSILRETIDSATRQYQKFKDMSPSEKVKTQVVRNHNVSWMEGLRKKLNPVNPYEWSFEYQFIDRLRPFKDIVKTLASKSKPVDSQNDSMKKMLRILGSEGEVKKYLEYGDSDKGVKGILQTIKELSKEDMLYDMEEYLIAKRNIELSERGITGLKHLSVKESEELIETMENKYGKTKLEDYSQDIYDYNSFLLEKYYEAGKLTEENYEKIKANNQAYVPFKRFFDEYEMHNSVDIRKVLSDTSPSPVKAIKGSSRQIISPFESIIKNTYDITMAINRNDALKTLLKNLQDIDKTLVQKIPTTSIKMKPTIIDGEIELKPVYEGFDKPQNTPIITIWNNGKPEFWEIPKEYYDSFFSLSQPISQLMRILSLPTRVLHAGAVGYEPTFMVRNIFRDQVTAMFNSKYGYIPFYDFFRGILEIAGKGSYYQKFLESGGDMSFLTAIDRLMDSNQLVKIRGDVDSNLYYRKYLKNPLLLLSDINRMSELGTRVAIFKKTLEKTGDIGEAMKESREVTADYSRYGMMMRSVSPLYAFLNAKMQHLNIVRGVVKGERGNRSKKVLLGILSITIPSLLNWLLNNNEENKKDYDNLSTPRKLLFWNIKIPGTESFIPIPKSLYGMIFGSSIESFLDHSVRNDKDAIANLMKYFMQDVSPMNTAYDIFPTGARPIVEQLANKKAFSGQDIVPQRLKDLEEREQYTESTPEIYKAMGEKFNLSPLRIQALLEGYTAGISRNVALISDELLETAGVIPDNDNTKFRVLGIDLTQMPGTKALLTGDQSGAKSQKVQNFYNKLDELEEINKTVNNLVGKGNVEKVEKYLEDKRADYQYYLNNSAEINHYKTALQISRDIRSELIQAGKKDEIKKLNDLLITVADGFRQSYDTKEKFDFDVELRDLLDEKKGRDKEKENRQKEFKQENK